MTDRGPMGSRFAEAGPEPVAGVKSFILERPKGNAIIYDSPGLSEAADRIRALGGATRLVINHGHEATYGRPPGSLPRSTPAGSGCRVPSQKPRPTSGAS